MATLLTIVIGALVASGQGAEAVGQPGREAPRTVEEAVEILLQDWLSESDRDWILRNPQDVVGSQLHVGFGTGVRNKFGLWEKNRDLLASCGVSDAEECSGLIFGRLWAAVRQAAPSDLVKRLDCQFALAESIPVVYVGFSELRVGEVLERIQEQIDSHLATLETAPPAGCEAMLKLLPTGEFDLDCWARVEFSEDGEGPVSLRRLLGWISWRNGFDVRHSPPDIELPFRERCAWPELPELFRQRD